MFTTHFDCLDINVPSLLIPLFKSIISGCLDSVAVRSSSLVNSIFTGLPDFLERTAQNVSDPKIKPSRPPKDQPAGGFIILILPAATPKALASSMRLV